jgi:NADPH:quinone reductase-like Zn-dependent oxidoreductase
MKAARIHNFGPPDVVLMEDVPRPVPAGGEVLVRVVAAGVVRGMHSLEKERARSVHRPR